MTNELLDAHGLPRREFLKKAAIGAFAAPVIVSFGLGATAEAGTAFCANQTIANQRALSVGNIVVSLWNAEHKGLASHTFASRLRGELLTAERYILDGLSAYACHQLDLVWRQLEEAPTGSIDPGTASGLAAQVKNVWVQSGCC